MRLQVKFVLTILIWSKKFTYCPFISDVIMATIQDTASSSTWHATMNISAEKEHICAVKTKIKHA